jgi:hypothetical protein
MAWLDFLFSAKPGGANSQRDLHEDLSRADRIATENPTLHRQPANGVSVEPLRLISTEDE